MSNSVGKRVQPVGRAGGHGARTRGALHSSHFWGQPSRWTLAIPAGDAAPGQNNFGKGLIAPFPPPPLPFSCSPAPFYLLIEMKLLSYRHGLA